MFRFAIWACVSSSEQAEDKESIPHQIRDCRAMGERTGGTESHEPFVAAGYSRSFYEGLGEAMADIPALKELIDSASRDEYDVLICRYFERFGSVAYPVFVRLGKMKKQLRSVQEPTQIIPPDLYDVTKDEATSMMIHMSGIKQDYRINRIVNNRRDMMPRRIKDGLPAGKIPYGYQFVSTKQPAIQIPEQCAKLLEARNMLFDGESYLAIAEHLGVSHNSVRKILENPYYAGIIAYPKRIGQYVENRQTRVYTDPSTHTIGQGKHTPIWTPAEYQDILAETQRREEVTKGNKPTHAYMGLLRCGTCGETLKQRQKYSANSQQTFMICRRHGVGHVGYLYDELHNTITKEIQTLIRRTQAGEINQTESDERRLVYEKAIAKKQHERRQIQAGLLADPPAFTPAEAGRMVREIDKEIEKHRHALERIQQEQATRRASVRVIQTSEYMADNLPLVFKHQPPEKINAVLRGWIKEIQIWNNGIIKVILL